MKKVLIAILLLAPALVFAEKKPAPNPADYTIAVHLQSSQLIIGIQNNPTQHLDVLIDGKKYALEAGPCYSVLPSGDYKARLVKDAIAKDHEYTRVYELLFTDGTTRKYSVVGESE